MVASSGGRSTGVRPRPIRPMPSGALCVDPRRPRQAKQRFCAQEHQIGATPRDVRLSRPVSFLPRSLCIGPSRSVRSFRLDTAVCPQPCGRGKDAVSCNIRTNCARPISQFGELEGFHRRTLRPCRWAMPRGGARSQSRESDPIPSGTPTRRPESYRVFERAVRF